MKILGRPIGFGRACSPLFSLLLLLLISCNLQVTRPPVPPSCRVEELIAPDPISPSNHTTVSNLTPTLSWNFAPYCVPPAYYVMLSTSSNFWDIGRNRLLDGTHTSWTLETPLSEGQDYYWKVAAAAWNEETLRLSYGPYSEVRHFNTGERCDALGVETHVYYLNYPKPGQTVYTFTPVLDWDNSYHCLEDYGVEISGYSDFADSWRTVVHERSELNVREFPGPHKLNNCTWYYWHVWPSRYPDRVSDTRRFFVNASWYPCLTRIEPFRPTPPQEPLGIPPSPTFTNTSEPLKATALADAECRVDPFSSSELVGIFRKGQTALVTARDSNNVGFQIALPETSSLCWVWKELVILNGDPNTAPVLVIPSPTPASTITRTPCTPGKPCQ